MTNRIYFVSVSVVELKLKIEFNYTKVFLMWIDWVWRDLLVQGTIH